VDRRSRDEKKDEAVLSGENRLILADPERAGDRLLHAYFATT
jgi:hypothetical protein